LTEIGSDLSATDLQQKLGPTTPEEAAKVRRTFAIISHPDAGKTTLTENLLLMGGAIHLAGEVKARGEARRAKSDWMKIEQQRGISVTTAVMTFEYRGITFNLLDTPGHEDFSEDTYRTLTAADSAIMVVDAAKGIEPQTLKLFEVCRLRDIPIITLVNKIDRESRDPFEILDEIGETLALDTTPMTWPAGLGRQLKGIYNLSKDQFVSYSMKPEESKTVAADEMTSDLIDEPSQTALMEDIELVRDACPTFNLQSYREGHLTPVFFGSALRRFGTSELLDAIADFAPPPRSQSTATRQIEPQENKVSGFVFKVQANMDPNHRDRVAFMRLCSGRFKRGMKLKQFGSTKAIGIHNPILFFAQNRELAEEAWPGDIIGIPNHGTLRVGDSLSEAGDLKFTGIPNFAPEILRRVRLGDPMKAKHMRRALESLAEEGVTQVFKPHIGANWIIGVVGPLQLDVLIARVEAEYDLKIDFEAAPFETARWVSSDDPEKMRRFEESNRTSMAEDRDGNPVFLAKNDWEVGYVDQKWAEIDFSKTCERH
jgi:peptide chain release factor 3